MKPRLIVLLTLPLIFLSTASAFGADAVSEDAVPADWAHTIGTYSNIVLDLIAPIIAVLVAYLVKTVKDRFGAQAAQTVDSLLESAVEKGINYAEEWARKQESKPSSDEKLQKAIDFAASVIEDHGLQAVAGDRLAQWIESRLFDKRES